MPNYVKTGPFVNGGAPGISAQFLNNVENVFSQPAGGTEVGSYYLTGNGNQNASIGYWVGSLSRGSTPVSVTLDASLQGAFNCNGAQTDHLTSNGFHVYTQLTATVNAANVGGNWTIQY